MSRLRLATAIIWASLHQIQTGYHITALNGIQAAILCDAPIDTAPWRMLPSWMLPYVGSIHGCVKMNSSRFGLVVAVFTFGSLMGSLLSSQVTPLIGRVGTLRMASMLCLLGSLFLAISNTTNDMIFSRMVVGIGCGLSTVTVPIYLTSLAPSLRNNLGILNQLAMVVGLIIAQSLSLVFSRQFAWRFVLIIATTMGAILLGLSLFVADGDPSTWRRESVGDEETPLLPTGTDEEHLTMTQLFRTKKREVRRGFRVLLVTQLASQVCGISPVVYFSTSILRKVFKTNAALVALLILFVKLPASLCTIPLLPYTGSKKLLKWTSLAEAISLFGLALGLNMDYPGFAAVCLIIFIFAFGLGTGPVTWVVLSEVMPPEARTAATSVGISLNGLTSFIISSTFLPLQEWLETGDGTGIEGEGNVFFVFCGFCIISLVVVRWCFRRYEKALIMQE